MTCWRLQKMEEMPKYYTNEKTWHKKDNVIIIKPKNWAATIDCPICNLVLQSERDYIMLKKEGCCYLCCLHYKFAFKEKWKKGWRPTNIEARNKINNN